VILASKCSIFKAMFANGLLESQKREIVINNVHHDVFMEILSYIYTDQAPDITSSTAIQLLICADMYLLEDLKQHIQFFLEDFVDLDSCCELLDVADQYSCNRLFAAAVNFIQKNFDKVAQREEYTSLGEQLKLHFANTKKKKLLLIQEPEPANLVNRLETKILAS